MNKEIIKLEAKLNKAILVSDVKVLTELLHDDLIFVNYLGMKLSKTEDLAQHVSGDLKITSLELSDQSISTFDDTVVVVVSKQIKGIYLQQQFESKLRFMRIWKLSNGQWKVVAVSSSAMTE